MKYFWLNLLTIATLAPGIPDPELLIDAVLKNDYELVKSLVDNNFEFSQALLDPEIAKRYIKETPEDFTSLNSSESFKIVSKYEFIFPSEIFLNVNLFNFTIPSSVTRNVLQIAIEREYFNIAKLLFKAGFCSDFRIPNQWCSFSRIALKRIITQSNSSASIPYDRYSFSSYPIISDQFDFLLASGAPILCDLQTRSRSINMLEFTYFRSTTSFLKKLYPAIYETETPLAEELKTIQHWNFIKYLDKLSTDNINTVNEFGETPLISLFQIPAMRNYPSLFPILKSLEALGANFNAQNSSQQTALMRAIHLNFPLEVINFLITKTDLGILDSFGKDWVDYLEFFSAEKLCELFKMAEFDVNFRNESKDSMLLHYARYHNVAMILIEKGANVFAKTKKYNRNVLMIAIEGFSSDFALHCYEGINTKQKNLESFQSLHEEMMFAYLDILIKKGVNINDISKNKAETVLFEIFYLANLQLLQFLLKRGLNLKLYVDEVPAIFKLGYFFSKEHYEKDVSPFDSKKNSFPLLQLKRHDCLKYLLNTYQVSLTCLTFLNSTKSKALEYLLSLDHLFNLQTNSTKSTKQAKIAGLDCNIVFESKKIERSTPTEKFKLKHEINIYRLGRSVLKSTFTIQSENENVYGDSLLPFIIRNYQPCLNDLKIFKILAVIHDTDLIRRSVLSLAMDYPEGNELGKFLVENGADVNFADTFKRTPLMFAVEQQNEEMIDFLITNGAEIQGIDSFGISVLGYAARANNENTVKFLVKNGCTTDLDVCKNACFADSNVFDYLISHLRAEQQLELIQYMRDVLSNTATLKTPITYLETKLTQLFYANELRAKIEYNLWSFARASTTSISKSLY